MGRGHRPRILRGAAALVQPGHTSHLHTRWAHTQGPQEQWSWLVGTFGPLAAIHFPRGSCPLFRVGTLRLPPGVCVCGAACSRLHPPPRPAPPHPPPAKWGAVAAAPGQYLMSQELLEPRARGQTLLVHLGLCPAPKGAWPFSQRAQPGGTQLPGGTEIWGPLGRSHRVREIGTPPPGFLRRPRPLIASPEPRLAAL